ncbi:MAG: YdhR family protein [Betaproteobacteria bacterium]
MKVVAEAPLAALVIATVVVAQTTGAAAAPVVTVVRVPKPWIAPKALVASRMRDTMAEYDKNPGLSFKIYTISQTEARYGGIYLWTDRASAQSWFNPAWFARVRTTRRTR